MSRHFVNMVNYIIRNAENVDRIVDHGGTCYIWQLLNDETDVVDNMKALGIVEVEGVLESHIDDYEEYYFILDGTGRVDVEGEQEDVFPGDLIYIPRGKMHGIESLGKNYPIRFLAFMLYASD